jgi:hypothetical protein
MTVMRTWSKIVVMALAAALAVGSAIARPGDGGRHGERFADPGSMPPMMPGQGFERPMRPEFRRDEPPAFGRMSPEERRQLRRDIRDAGEGLYRRPMREMPPRGF